MEATMAEIDAKEADLLNVLTLAASYTLASGEMAPTDPEFKVMIAQGETTGFAILRRVESSRDMIADYGGEEMAAALRRKEAATAVLKTRAEEFVGFMRDMAALIELEEEKQLNGSGPSREREGPTPNTSAQNGKLKNTAVASVGLCICHGCNPDWDLFV
jgi:hypothetical protein